MDAHDIAHPTRLEEQLGFLRAHPDVGLVGTQIEPLGSARIGRGSRLATEHDRIYEELLHGRHAMCNPTIMCRTALLGEVGGYFELGVLEDWAMFLAIGRKSRLANVDRVLLSYRVHYSHFNGKRMREMRPSIAYACDRARRQDASLEEISYEDFVRRKEEEPLWRRMSFDLEAKAMNRYRKAQAEILGDHAMRGYLNHPSSRAGRSGKRAVRRRGAWFDARRARSAGGGAAVAEGDASGC